MLLIFEGIPEGPAVWARGAVTFDSGWLAIVDDDNGGSGSIANEPSSSTVAITGSTTSLLTFGTPVGSVGFMYSLDTTSGNAVVTFRDSSGAVLGTRTMDVCGAIYCGNSCAGDPNGPSCGWGTNGFTTSVQPGIASVEINGFVGWFMDDLTYDPDVAP